MRGQARGPGERQAKKGTTHLPPTPGPSLLSSSFLPAFSRPSPCTQSLCPRHPHPCLSTISQTLRSLPKPQALLESLPPLPSFLCILGSPKSQTKFLSWPLFASVSLHLCPTLSPKACAFPRPSWSSSLPTCLTPQPRRIDLPGLRRCQPLAWRPRAWAIQGEVSRKRRGGDTRASAPRETRVPVTCLPAWEQMTALAVGTPGARLCLPAATEAN